jgi:hypothetical protein
MENRNFNKQGLSDGQSPPSPALHTGMHTSYRGMPTNYGKIDRHPRDKPGHDGFLYFQ